jgi:outer membrane protein TolC
MTVRGVRLKPDVPRGRRLRVALVWLVLWGPSLALAQDQPAAPPVPQIRVTFAEAIRRAQESNPTVAAAAASILRAESMVRQARAATLLQVNANVTSTTLNRGVQFEGTTVTPRSQVSAMAMADMPILAAAAWARRAQAADQQTVAELSVTDIRRQVALATADAYLAIIAQRRVVSGNVRARDVSRAHFDLATELERAGRGSRLNALRAEQQVETNASLLENAGLGLYRAQEALGVLIAADGPADAADDPDLSAAANAAQTDAAQSAAATIGLLRTDLKLFTAQQQAASRVLRDSSRDWWPAVNAQFQPATMYPGQFFLPQNSWRFLVIANIPIFDSGQRTALRLDRQAAVNETQATVAGANRQASSEVRAAREAIASSERGLTSARAAAERAQQVVDITNISFRAGAATNIEVIDADRTARDADMTVAIAEDQLRRARLELLNALGRFP